MAIKRVTYNTLSYLVAEINQRTYCTYRGRLYRDYAAGSKSHVCVSEVLV